MAIEDMLLMTSGSNYEVHFKVVKEPVAQNGWKLAWKKCRCPYLYDPLRSLKKAIREEIIQSIEEFNSMTPFFPHNTYIEGSITFHTNSMNKKDLDNMAKFILDAMEGAIYQNDKHLIKLVLQKKPLTNGQKAFTDITLATSH